MPRWSWSAWRSTGDLTQLDKALRLRQLSRLLDQFERFATPSARREYQRLIRCERTPL